MNGLIFRERSSEGKMEEILKSDSPFLFLLNTNILRLLKSVRTQCAAVATTRARNPSRSTA